MRMGSVVHLLSTWLYHQEELHGIQVLAYDCDYQLQYDTLQYRWVVVGGGYLTPSVAAYIGAFCDHHVVMSHQHWSRGACL